MVQDKPAAAEWSCAVPGVQDPTRISARSVGGTPRDLNDSLGFSCGAVQYIVSLEGNVQHGYY